VQFILTQKLVHAPSLSYRKRRNLKKRPLPPISSPPPIPSPCSTLLAYRPLDPTRYTSDCPNIGYLRSPRTPSPDATTICGISDIFISWNKISPPVPPRHIDDDAAISRGIVCHRPCPAPPSPQPPISHFESEGERPPAALWRLRNVPPPSRHPSGCRQWEKITTNMRKRVSVAFCPCSQIPQLSSPGTVPASQERPASMPDLTPCPPPPLYCLPEPHMFVPTAKPCPADLLT
jgi:hypothetical protein